MIWGGSSKRVKSLLSGFIAARETSNESVVALARRAPPCHHPGPGAALGATRRAAQTHTAVDRAVEATARPVHDRARARLPQDPAPEVEATPVPVQGQDLAIELVLGGKYFSLFDSVHFYKERKLTELCSDPISDR